MFDDLYVVPMGRGFVFCHLLYKYLVPKGTDDFELSPFVDEGGFVPKGCIRRKFYQLFGGDTEKIIKELNRKLVA
jgi:hypothetical protein